MVGAILYLGLGLVIAWGAMTLYTARMLTRPPRRTAGWAVARGRASTPEELSGEYGPPRGFEEWMVKTARGELPVWDIRGDDPGGAVTIITHGWGESRVVTLMRVNELAKRSRRVIVWDLPGHGDAPGLCTLGVHEPACLIALVERVREQGAGLVLFGSSLGAGVCIAACAAGLPGGVGGVGGVRLVLEAPYRVPPTPARNVLRSRALPWRLNLIPALWLAGLRIGAPTGWLRAGGPFDRSALAARVRGVPTTIIVGDRDETCPPEEAEAIAGACGARLEVIRGAGHLDLWTDHLGKMREAINTALGGGR